MLEVIDFYNSNKFGVDIINQMIDDVSYDITTRRWPLKTFNYLVDVACLNAFVLFKQHLRRKGDNVNYDDSMRKKFLYKLANQLMSDQVTYMEAHATSYVYKAFKEANDHIKNVKKKFTGLLPSTVKWCHKSVGPDAGHAVRDQHVFKCDHCEKPACENHIVRKAYCISCSTKIKFEDENMEEEENDDKNEPIAKRTRSQTQ